MDRLLKKSTFTLALVALLPMLASAAQPSWVAGENLGRIDNVRGLDQAQLHARAQGIAAGLLGAAPDELRAARSHTDQLGMTHVRMHQFLNGRRVFGADVVLHARANGDVYLVNGHYYPVRGARTRARVAADEALALSITEAGIGDFRLLGAPELVYAVGGADDGVHLAWRALVEYQGSRAARDWVFADATDGSLVALHPTIHYAKSWQTYDAMDAAYNAGSMPGTLVCTNAQSCGLADAQDAHDGASTTYDYYLSKFGRDSLNDAGMTLVSSVNVCGFNNSGCSGWNNAAWTGSQMVYGDGDGVTFSPLSGDVDVVGHELTHGVTDFTSNLIYSSDSGALNEGLSDIFGASIEAWSEGGISADTWKLGEDVYTPGIPNDALRYMNDPTLDGYSTDFYPERLYAGYKRQRCNGNNDYCGVHGNSGIANLAYVLLVEGGTHPRGKTTNTVPAVGLAAAEQIFYRANANYFTSGMNFAQASTSCQQAAADLYSSVEVDAVLQAWCAVGVGSNCGGGTGCVNPGGAPQGASCSSNSQCCSNSCKGKPGSKTCK